MAEVGGRQELGGRGRRVGRVACLHAFGSHHRRVGWTRELTPCVPGTRSSSTRRSTVSTLPASHTRVPRSSTRAPRRTVRFTPAPCHPAHPFPTDGIRYLSLHDNNYVRYFKGHKKKSVLLALPSLLAHTKTQGRLPANVTSRRHLSLRRDRRHRPSLGPPHR